MLELLVTMFIMVLMTGVVAVSMAPALENARLHTGTRTLIAALRYARSYAVTYQTETLVVLDRERRGVFVQRRLPDEDGQEIWQDVTTQAGRFRKLPEGVAIVDLGYQQQDGATEENPTVRFTALGQGESVSITLSDEHEHQQIILVDAVTGRCALADQEE